MEAVLDFRVVPVTCDDVDKDRHTWPRYHTRYTGAECGSCVRPTGQSGSRNFPHAASICIQSVLISDAFYPTSMIRLLSDPVRMTAHAQQKKLI